MKDNHRSRVQRPPGMLAGTAQQLLQQFRQTPEQPERPVPEEALALNRHRQSFSSEMFAELLIELPEFQGKISQAYRTGDRQSLRNHLHQLLGAVAYCDAPELETALRNLHQALRTEDPNTPDTIAACYTQACSAINSTLHYSGYHG